MQSNGYPIVCWDDFVTTSTVGNGVSAGGGATWDQAGGNIMWSLIA